MKLSLIISAAILMLLPQSKWEHFVSYEGRFKVLTPGEFVESAKEVETEIGTLTYHTFYFQEKEEKSADNLFYMVSYVDYPEGSIHSDSLELLPSFFETTIETAAKSVDGSLLYSSEINLFDYPGRLWRIDYLEEKVTIKTKGILANSRYYNIQTISLKGKNLNPMVDKFLDSFKIIDKKE